MVEYRLAGIAGTPELYRLVTTLIDPDRAPAAEPAALYHGWEIETVIGGRFRSTPRFPPRRRVAFHDVFVDEILEETVSSSRRCSNSRAVKRKVGKFPIRHRVKQPTAPRVHDYADHVEIVR